MQMSAGCVIPPVALLAAGRVTSYMQDIEADARRAVRNWLIRVKETTGLSWTQIAKAAGIATSTLTKHVNDPDHPHVLSTLSVAKIARATGLKPPDFFSGGAQTLAEPEASPYRPDEDSDYDRMIKAYLDGRPGLDPWVLTTGALKLAGYLPGDIMIVDLNATPQPHDVVCAQVYDFRAMRAETIWRRYEPPYLVAVTDNPALLKPERDDNAKIKGVVVASFRGRSVPQTP